MANNNSALLFANIMYKLEALSYPVESCCCKKYHNWENKTKVLSGYHVVVKKYHNWENKTKVLSGYHGSNQISSEEISRYPSPVATTAQGERNYFQCFLQKFKFLVKIFQIFRHLSKPHSALWRERERRAGLSRPEAAPWPVAAEASGVADIEGVSDVEGCVTS